MSTESLNPKQIRIPIKNIVEFADRVAADMRSSGIGVHNTNHIWQWIKDSYGGALGWTSHPYPITGGVELRYYLEFSSPREAIYYILKYGH